MDECIADARSALLEFPGNEKLMLCLASLLYNAGYVRHGEHHLTDANGYDIFDTARHREYNEWQEAIQLYEKLLSSLGEGTLRQTALLRNFPKSGHGGVRQPSRMLRWKSRRIPAGMSG